MAESAFVESIGGSWFSELQVAVASEDTNKVVSLFLLDGYWRDLHCLSWDNRTLYKIPTIKAFLDEDNRFVSAGFTGLKLEGAPILVQANKDFAWIQCFFAFETTLARGRGFFRLMQDANGSWKAKTFYTGIEELKGYEEKFGNKRPSGTSHGDHIDRLTWKKIRATKKEFVDSEPQVIIIGAGQSGLSLGARLGQLNVDTLIIDKNERVGDNWRKRYDFLVLHDPVWYDHMAYIPFPSHWPVFTPKDKIADWFESYVMSMELNVWTQSTVTSAAYDESKHEWTVKISRKGFPDRVLKPTFVVIATGHSGEINVPTFKGQEKFAGKICHSSQHTSGEHFKGKRAVVVGSCNSGLDIAQDFYEQGVGSVTVVQRSSTYIMSSEHGLEALVGSLYYEGGPPTEDADIISSSIPNHMLMVLNPYVTKILAQKDKDMLDGLERAGFKLDYGPDGGGMWMKYVTRGGGYYIDVGASKLIINGDIKLKQGHEISEITKDGLVFDDDTELQADVIVLATGYQNMKASAVKILGEEANRMNEVWGLDEEGEIKVMWRASGHPGIYTMAGNLGLCRFYSKKLALRIKAQLEGLAPF